MNPDLPEAAGYYPSQWDSKVAISFPVNDYELTFRDLASINRSLDRYIACLSGNSPKPICKHRILISIPHSYVTFLLMQYCVLRQIEICIVNSMYGGAEFKEIEIEYKPTIVINGEVFCKSRIEDFFTTFQREITVNQVNSVVDQREKNAYVLYSSGTTGKPKGIGVTRINLCAFMESMDEVTEGMSDITKCVSPFSPAFDFSIGSFLYPLFRGKHIYIGPSTNVLFWLRDLIMSEKNIDLISLVPTMADLLVDSLMKRKVGLLTNLQGLKFWFCGEPLLVSTIKTLNQFVPQARYINFYGPTETTVFATFHKVGSELVGTVVPIGKPLKNLGIKLEDFDPGTGTSILVITGDQVGRYLNVESNRGETRFLSDIEFRTGDIVRVDSEGLLHFVDRVGDIIKFRGKRYSSIALKEKLTKFLGFPCCEILQRYESKKVFVIVIGGEDLPDLADFEGPAEIKAAKVIGLASVPLNNNGKLDRSKILKVINEEL